MTTPSPPSIEGLAIGALRDGVLEIAIAKMTAGSLRLAAGPLTVDIGSLTLHKLAAQLLVDAGGPRLRSLDAAFAELSGVKIHGPVLLAGRVRAAPGAGWSLAPLASAHGSLRATIPDAHLMFDAGVTVPVRQGEIEFSDATVEHVGPDSRMGISPQGLYVDAPNGRSYLYQFASAAVAGVEFERRDALLGPWVSDRGKLKLQAFAEGLMAQVGAAPGAGFSAPARQLVDRTSLAGEVALGDGRFAGPGLHAELAGSAGGRNVLRVASEAVGRGLTAEVAALSLRGAAWTPGAIELACAELAGALMLRLVADGALWRVELGLESATVSGLHLQLNPPGQPPAAPPVNTAS